MTCCFGEFCIENVVLTSVICHARILQPLLKKEKCSFRKEKIALLPNEVYRIIYKNKIRRTAFRNSPAKCETLYCFKIYLKSSLMFASLYIEYKIFLILLFHLSGFSVSFQYKAQASVKSTKGKTGPSV